MLRYFHLLTVSAQRMFLFFALASWVHLAQSQRVVTKAYPTLGNPTTALATFDGRFVFVSVTNVGAANFKGPDAAAGSRSDVVSGIQVFRVKKGRLLPETFVRVGGKGANGLVLLPGSKTLVVGAGDAGVAFLDVHDAIRGRGVPIFVSQGAEAGVFDVVASRDGRYVFSANEYGVVDEQRGSVGVIATNIDVSGRVHEPKAVGRIAMGDVVPSITISPDGSRLYVATELLPAHRTVTVAGADNPALAKQDCVQKKGTAAHGNGFISVIDVGRAISHPTVEAILSRVASGCSPVRIAESNDMSSLYVSARGDNAVLEFDVKKLESNPVNAFRQTMATGGHAPVGLRLFQHDQWLAVANSNRFSDVDGTLAFLKLRAPSAKPLLVSAGTFPRNIGLAHDAGILYLTNYTSRTLQVIDSKGIAQ